MVMMVVMVVIESFGWIVWLHNFEMKSGMGDCCRFFHARRVCGLGYVSMRVMREMLQCNPASSVLNDVFDVSSEGSVHVV